MPPWPLPALIDDMLPVPIIALALRPPAIAPPTEPFMLAALSVATDPPAGPKWVAADGTDARLDPSRGVVPSPLHPDSKRR